MLNKQQFHYMLFKISNCYLIEKLQLNLLQTKQMHYKNIIGGQGIVWVWSNDSSIPLQPIVATFHNDKKRDNI